MASQTQLKRSNPEAEGIDATAVLNLIHALEQHPTHPLDAMQGFMLLRHGNVVAEGLWGFTEDDGTPTGRTPPAIRRATMLLVLRSLAPLADDASFEARSRWRIIEERTRDQSYRLDPSKASASASLTGDPEIDALLALYLRPSPLGAV